MTQTGPDNTHWTAAPFGSFLERVAAKTPTPGGGAVASAVGALGAALAGMVVVYSLGKKNLAPYEPALQDAAMRLGKARAVLLTLADEDAEAYGLVNELSKLAETDERRRREWPGAVRASVQVPSSVIAACADLLRLMGSLAGMTNRHLRSDLAIAAVLAAAAARSSRWNVLVNAPWLATEDERRSAIAGADAMAAECVRLAADVERRCEAPT